ncbi:MAG: N-acetylneuraminate synthase family protein, partial [Candidatus Omnitrophota bacterium]
HIASKGKPVIISTGMSYLEEIKKALDWIDAAREGSSGRPAVTLLHCVSDYPAEPEDINLLAMESLASNFDLPVGYSDHTRGIEVSIAAAALGATVIEKHFTLDRSMEGPDHNASAEPEELRAMVAAIRNVEKALGDGVKRPAKCEDRMRNIARRSLVAACDIKAGEAIRREDIRIKRPGMGLPPERIEDLINKKASRDIEKDTLFTLEHINITDNKEAAR